jgi:hypothetical protein
LAGHPNRRVNRRNRRHLRIVPITEPLTFSAITPQALMQGPREVAI